MFAESQFYFAYGSNLHIEDLARWAGARYTLDIRAVHRAYWPDHAPVFHYHSPVRRGGALDITPQRGACAPGVLFEVRRGWDALDAKEGAPDRYRRVRGWAIIDGPISTEVPHSTGTLVRATTYCVSPALRQSRHVEPTESYSAIVREALATWRLDGTNFERAVCGSPAESFPKSIFVYGTLKRGHERASIMEAARPQSVENATLEGDLVNLGAYPGLRLESGMVHGELWTYESDACATLLAELDEVEDFRGWQRVEESLYYRAAITVDVAGDARNAWTYVYRGPGDARIPDGVWRGA